MEESIKIQEEFENLIEQLERLKNINELTSANADNSQRVIEQIDLFIKGMNQYKQTLDENTAKQALSIQNLIESLNESINAVEDQKNIVSKSVDSSFLGLQKTTIQELELHKTELKNISDKTFKFIENRTKELSKNIEDSLEKVEIQFKDFKSNTKANFNSLTGIVSNKIELTERSITESKTLLIDKLEQSETNLTAYYSKQFNSLTSKINETEIDFAKKFEKQAKEVNTLKALLFIICGLIVIGIVATILK